MSNILELKHIKQKLLHEGERFAPLKKMNIYKKEAAKFLLENDNFYILSHIAPDGDTIGASFGLYYALKSLGKKAKIFCCDKFAEKYDYMAAEYVAEDFQGEAIVACDAADMKRLGNVFPLSLTSFFEAGKHPVEFPYNDIYDIDLCIDHHISNNFFAKRTCLDSQAAATCEFMYEIITEMGVEISPIIATCLYTGIITDSGCFRFDNTTAKTHYVVSKLMEIPFNSYEINRAMFDIKKMERLRLESILVNEMQTFFNGRVKIVVVRHSQLDELGLKDEDLEGITTITTQIEGVLVGIVVKEKDDGKYKLSLRSTSNINVSDICQKFGGGGHLKAAGCIIAGTEKDVISQIIYALGDIMAWGSVSAE
jgi:phosphoesterase RecJ-like protein